MYILYGTLVLLIMRTKDESLSFTRKDFQIQWFSGKGAGGQHRNKHQNCCRITHIESGLSETGQNHKERHLNFRDAFQRLASRVVSYYDVQRQHPKNLVTIRTYNVPDNWVKDHVSGKRTSWKGFDIGNFIGRNKFL